MRKFLFSHFRAEELTQVQYLVACSKEPLFFRIHNLLTTMSESKTIVPASRPKAVDRSKKYFGKFKKPRIKLPNLVESQIESFDWLIKKGINEVFKEFSSIKDYSDKKFELEFLDFKLGVPQYDEHYAKNNKLSYEASLKIIVRLTNKMRSSTKEQEIFMADFPMMTNHGTFIVSGIERVIVPQLARSFGIFFTSNEVRGRLYFGAKIIPARGAWIEIESEPDGSIYIRIDRKRKFAATSLLRVL